MSKETKTTSAVEKKEDRIMEFVPYGAKDSIKLTIKIIQSLIAVPTRSGKNCSEADAMKFMMMCQARKLNPFEGDSFLIGYDTKDGPKFSLITAHQAFIKRAECNPEYDGMKSGIIVRRQDGDSANIIDVEGDFHLPDDEVLGGWATVYFKNRTHPMSKRIRLDRFKKDTPIWRDDPAGMICKCAEADALRSSFPTLLGGMYLREEIEVAEVPKLAAPIFGDSGKSPDAPPPTPVSDITILAEQSGVSVSEVVQFAVDMGMAGKDCLTLDHILEDDPEILENIIKNWPDVSAKIIAIRKEASE